MNFTSSYAGKRCLIFGHTGFKGRWLSTWLVSLGAEVAGFSLSLDEWKSSCLPDPGLLANWWVDVADGDAVVSCLRDFNPDFIFYLAAQPIVSASIVDPYRTFRTNVMGAVNILHGLLNIENAVCIFVTSDKCYENREWVYGYREIDRLGGKDPYSASKACAEIWFAAFCQTYRDDLESRAIKLSSVRAGNVVGGGDISINRLIPDCIFKWCKSEAVELRSPYSTRPWQHVLDPLSGYLSLGACLADNQVSARVNYQSFNFGPNDSGRTVLEVVEELKLNWSTNSPYYIVQDNQNDLSQKESALLSLNIEKVSNLIGWSPLLSFEKTIELTAEWYEVGRELDFDEEKIRSSAITIKQIREFESMCCGFN